MYLKLTRNDFRADGIFSTLTDEQDNVLAVTLEHSFNNLPVIPSGIYLCVRGDHYLHGMTTPFSTFEITGVEGHVGLLFHWGNFNKDSEGCVLVGEAIGKSGGAEMITNSRVTFEKLMTLLTGVDQFILTVV